MDAHQINAGYKIDCRAEGHAPLQEQIPPPLPCQCGNQDAILTSLLNLQQHVLNLQRQQNRQSSLLQQILLNQSQRLFQTQPQRQHDANGLGCELHSTSQFAPMILDQDKSMGMIRNEDLSQNGIPAKFYQDLLERAHKIESIVKMPAQPQNSKRTRSEPQKGNIVETSANKKLATEHFSYPRCNKCHKHHLGECKMQLGSCFNCGEAGHFVRNCPTPKKPTTATDNKTEGIENECLERTIEHNLAENKGESLLRIDDGEVGQGEDGAGGMNM